ncbi:MAG: HAMP domain-containing sensor histidine kinase, partial [Erysipelotrichaceae bacterium]
INVTILIMSLLFFVLMVWFNGIIYPINLITDYVAKLKKGDESAKLKINRGDEIGKLGRAIEEMWEEIRRQEKTKEEMVHNISHDLKTPIATIKSYAESIKDGIYPYDTLEKSVDVIYQHAQRLEDKVQSLLALNRFGYILNEEKDFQDINIKEVVEKVLLAIKVIKPKITIIIKLEEVYFKGSEESWRVVVENILENALRYAESQISITLTDDELSIENDGPLLDENNLDKLFKPYEKGERGQFGLGLSIVKKACDTYGYNVYAYNYDEGVGFAITPKEQNKKKKPKISKKIVKNKNAE